jgi:hypothetical protein
VRPGKAHAGEGFAVVPESVLYAPVSSNAKVLWAVIRRHADPLLHAYPGGRRMAELMGVSQETVRRAKVELVEAGLLVAVERYDEAGRRTTDDLFLRTPGVPPQICGGPPTDSGGEEGDPHRFEGDDPHRFVGGNSKAVELEPEELEVVTRADNSRGPRPPTDTSPLTPDPSRRERNLAWVRAIRAGITPVEVDVREGDSETA